MRKLLAGMATLLCLGLVAAPASAKDKAPKDPYTYTATIDCGSGPVVVGSHDDFWADLVDLESGRVYKPVAWEVYLPGRAEPIVADKPGHQKRVVDCSYDDGFAKGTVTVKRSAGKPGR